MAVVRPRSPPAQSCRPSTFRPLICHSPRLFANGLATVLGIDLQGCFHMATGCLPHMKRTSMTDGAVIALQGRCACRAGGAGDGRRHWYRLCLLRGLWPRRRQGCHRFSPDCGGQYRGQTAAARGDRCVRGAGGRAGCCRLRGGGGRGGAALRPARFRALRPSVPCPRSAHTPTTAHQQRPRGAVRLTAAQHQPTPPRRLPGTSCPARSS